MTTLLAEFPDENRLIAAVRNLDALGYRGMETYAPIPLPELDVVLARKKSRIPALVFCAAVIGATAGYGVQWATIMDYPLRVASFPLPPVPALIPITFETMILFAALTAFVLVFVGTGMFQWWYPFDEVEGFSRSSIDRFFLALPVDAAHSAEVCRRDLEGVDPLRIVAVEGAP